MSAITQYEVERNSSALWAYPAGDDVLALRFACAADPDWFMQPLTLEVSLPASVKSAEVRDPLRQAHHGEHRGSRRSARLAL